MTVGESRVFNHDWPLILSLSREMLVALRANRKRVRLYTREQTSNEAFYAGEIGRHLGNIASQLEFQLSRNPRTSDDHFDRCAVIAGYRGMYADRHDVLQAVSTLWMFLEREVFSRLLALLPPPPEVDENGNYIAGSYQSALRLGGRTAGSQNCIAELLDMPESEITAFQENLNQLASVTNNDSQSTPDESIAPIEDDLSQLTSCAGSFYSPKELRKELKISGESVRKYANLAGVATPGRGKRNHRYSELDREKIIDEIINKSSDSAIVARCRELLSRRNPK